MLTVFRVGPSICFSSDSLIKRFTHVGPSFSLVPDKFSLTLKPSLQGVGFYPSSFGKYNLEAILRLRCQHTSEKKFQI